MRLVPLATAAAIALFASCTRTDERLVELRAEIERVRLKPVHARMAEFPRLKRMARTLAEAGLRPETANPPICNEAIRLFDQGLGAPEGNHAGCLTGVERRDLGNGWTMLVIGIYQPCGPDLSVAMHEHGRRRIEVEDFRPQGVALPWKLDDARIVPGSQGTTAVGLLSSVLWCTSTIHPVRLQAFVADHGKVVPMVDTIRLARVTSNYWMSLTSGEATLEFDSPEPTQERHVVARYQFTEGGAKRLPPIASSAHAFLTEWFAMPTTEAKDFVEGDTAKLIEWLEQKKGGTFEYSCGVGEFWQVPGAPVTMRRVGVSDYRIRYRAGQTVESCR